MRKCRNCGEEKDLSGFHRNKNSAGGRLWSCKVCRLARDVAYKDKHRERIYAQNDTYKRDHKKKIAAICKRYREENRDKIAAYQKEYRKNNRGRMNADASAYSCAKKKRAPAWADKKIIKEIYIDAKLLTDETGISFQVDHIVPLQGELVSGLHVENNLQILTAIGNHKKHNHFSGDQCVG